VKGPKEKEKEKALQPGGTFPICIKCSFYHVIIKKAVRGFQDYKLINDLSLELLEK